MNKVIMVHVDTDGFTYWCDVYTPMIAESPEAAYCAWCDARDATKENWFEFCGIEFNDRDTQIDGEPRFITIEEFFKDAHTV